MIVYFVILIKLIDLDLFHKMREICFRFLQLTINKHSSQQNTSSYRLWSMHIPLDFSQWLNALDDLVNSYGSFFMRSDKPATSWINDKCALSPIIITVPNSLRIDTNDSTKDNKRIFGNPGTKRGALSVPANVPELFLHSHTLSQSMT